MKPTDKAPNLNGQEQHILKCWGPYNDLIEERKVIVARYVYGDVVYSRTTLPNPGPFRRLEIPETITMQAYNNLLNTYFRNWNHTTYAVAVIEGADRKGIRLHVDWIFMWSHEDQIFLGLADEATIEKYQQEIKNELAPLLMQDEPDLRYILGGDNI